MKVLSEEAVFASLFACGALQFGVRKHLKMHVLDENAPKSYFYANIRNDPVAPVLLRASGEHMASAMHHVLELQDGRNWSVVGVPNGGVELAEGFVRNIHRYNQSGVTLIAPLEKVGEDSERHIQIVPRTLLPESPILLIENVVTTAASAIEAVKALRRYGGTVNKVMTLLDRELGGAENLAALGVELVSCCKITWLIDFLHEVGLIDDDTARNSLLNLQDMQLYLKQAS